MRDRINLQITAEGDVCIVDPDRELLELGLELDPQITVQVAPERSHVQKLQRARQVLTGVSRLSEQPSETLWDAHDACMQGEGQARGASLLDLKAELARRELAACRLCGHSCGVDRLGGQRGRCLLLDEAYHSPPFSHWGEEEPINPSLVVSLQGCAWRCRYCQQWELLQVEPSRGRRLDGSFWDLELDPLARSLSFLGGNPDESLPAILATLAQAPGDFVLPVVWNSNLYGSATVYRLLDGVVDTWLPDLRYGNDSCAQQLSGAGNYLSVARAGLLAMARQEATIVVRLLVLPGHFQCCHTPALEWLAENLGPRVLVSVRGQYYPEFRINARDGAMTRRPSAIEVREVEELVERLGLRRVDSGIRPTEAC